MSEEQGSSNRNNAIQIGSTHISSGLSRDRDAKQQSNNNNALHAPDHQPGSAGSQVRTLPVSHQNSQNQIIPTQRSAFIKLSQAQLEYSGEVSQNYGSQRDTDQTMPNSQNNYQQKQLPINDKTNTGVGSLSVINNGIITTSSNQRTVHMKMSAMTKDTPGTLKTELSVQDAQFNELRENNLKFYTKSKSNINLQQQQIEQSSPSIIQQQPVNDSNHSEMKLGTYGGKYQIKMNMSKINSLHKRGSQSNHDTNNNFNQIEVSPTNVRQGGFTHSNLLNKSIDEHNQNKLATKHFSTNPASQGPSEGNRKMSLAAKAGQMQIFNNINNQNLNNNSNALSQLDDSTKPLGDMPIPMNYNYQVKGKNMLQNNGQTGPQIQLGINGIQQQNNLPPSSNLQQQAAIGPRQLESYLGRRHVIQQQRDKKQELLKQLDMGRQNSQSINPSNFTHNTRNLQNATESAANDSHQLMIYNQANQYSNIGGSAINQISQ